MPDQGFRCGVPSGQIAEGASKTGGGSSSIRGRRTIKDQGIRRDNDAGLEPPPVSCAFTATHGPRSSSQSSGSVVSAHSVYPSRVDAGHAGPMPTPAVGASASISFEARGGHQQTFGKDTALWQTFRSEVDGEQQRQSADTKKAAGSHSCCPSSPKTFRSKQAGQQTT